MGIGALKFTDIPALQRTHRIYEPRMGQRGLYEEKFALFQELQRSLAPVYTRMNSRGAAA